MSGEAGSGGTGKRVLVVDDDRLLAETLREMIADVAQNVLHRRVEVSVSASARDAGRRIAASEADGAPFDAILCDLAMPGTDGLAFYEELRARAHPLAARFALITGGSFSPAAVAFLAAHPLPCLAKPFDDAQLGVMLRRLLEA